jgi:signal transduction histidine kinase
VTSAQINILIVDDLPENLLALETVLEAVDVNLVKASSGQEALRKILQLPFALVLLDVQMPEMDGYEVAELMRMNPQTRNVPIIFLTALSRESRHEFRGYEAGAVDYISKPIDPAILKSKVAIFCEIYRQRLVIEENYAKLRELEQMRDSLVHMTVHDLRTPLAGINGFAQILAMTETGLTPAGRDMLAIMEASSADLLETIGTILDVSKMEAGQMKLNLADCDVERLARAIETRLRPLVRQRTLDVRNELPEGFSMRADEALLSRVLGNLISNAVKFTPEDGGLIQVRLWREDGRFGICVRDNGPGVPPEYRSKVFEKFVQAENPANFKKFSTGLGLAFCRMAVESHGGKIWLENTEPPGASFRIDLPIAAPD